MCDSQCAHLLFLFGLNSFKNVHSDSWGFSGCRSFNGRIKAGVYMGGWGQMFNTLLTKHPSLKATTPQMIIDVYQKYDDNWASMLVQHIFIWCLSNQWAHVFEQTPASFFSGFIPPPQINPGPILQLPKLCSGDVRKQWRSILSWMKRVLASAGWNLFCSAEFGSHHTHCVDTYMSWILQSVSG